MNNDNSTLLVIGAARPIGGNLAIIDDIGVTLGAHPILKAAFSVPTEILSGLALTDRLWRMLKSDIDFNDPGTLVVYPGNGGWLVQRFIALADEANAPQHWKDVDISRVSTTRVDLPDHIKRVVIVEDVVETGGTAIKLREAMEHLGVPITLAVLLWHDRRSLTQQALNALQGFDRVYVAERITSDLPMLKDVDNDASAAHDARSLSTLARKRHIEKNRLYSTGREELFEETMVGCLERHPWVTELGVTLGFRKDAETAVATA